MYNIISIFNRELPVFKLFELYTQYDEHFDEKTKSKTRNTYIILLLVFKFLVARDFYRLTFFTKPSNLEN